MLRTETEMPTEPTPVPTDDPFIARPRAPAPAPRRLRAGLTVAAIVTVVAAAIAADPLIGVARDRSQACGATDRAHPGASADCAGHAAPWLWLPLVIPWTRGEALEAGAQIEWDEARRELWRATVARPDRAARDAAAEHLFAVAAAHPFHRPSTFFEVDTAGAREVVVAHAGQAEGTTELQTVLRNAVATGDREAAANAARRGATSYSAEGAALLCLVGDEEAARAALTEPAARWTEISPRPHPGIQTVLELCGGRPAAVDRGEAEAARLLTRREAVPTSELLRRGDEGLDASLRAPVYAEWLLAAERDPEVVVDRAARIGDASMDGVTPWRIAYPGLVSGGDRPIPAALEPRRAEAAADRLDELAGRISRGEVLIEARREFIHDPSVDREVREHAPEVLRRAATSLRTSAMLAFATFDRAEAARVASVLVAPEHPSRVRLAAASTLARVGRNEAAREGYEALIDDPSVEVRRFARLDLALLALGDADAEAAHAWALRATEDLPEGTYLLGGRHLEARDAAAVWVLLATSVRAGHLEDAPEWHLARVRGLPVAWTELLRGSPAERRRLRADAELFVDYAMLTVLPAVLYVAEAAIEEGAEGEVWAERLVGSYRPAANGARGLRARAEAARWRGDREAERRFEARADALEAPVHDTRTALLAALAEID